MKKVWDSPKIENLSVESTQAIIGQIQADTFGIGVEQKFRWYCDCCTAASDLIYKDEDEAIAAGKAEHGDPCPYLKMHGKCLIS